MFLFNYKLTRITLINYRGTGKHNECRENKNHFPQHLMR